MEASAFDQPCSTSDCLNTDPSTNRTRLDKKTCSKNARGSIKFFHVQTRYIEIEREEVNRCVDHSDVECVFTRRARE